MIVDHIENIGRYLQLKKYVGKITEFIDKCRKEPPEAGSYELLPEKELSALVQYYETKPKADGRMESHRCFSDLQYILEGRELIYYDMAKELTVSEDEAASKDIIFYRRRPDKGGNVLTAGMFAFYAPQDAHMPCIQYAERAENVAKIVFKIKNE